MANVVSEKKRFETFSPKGPMLNKSCRSRHFELQDLFNIGPFGENVSKRFFSETKLPRNDHWKVLCFLCRSEIQDGCMFLVKNHYRKQ
jgi:hypothetical protein